MIFFHTIVWFYRICRIAFYPDNNSWTPAWTTLIYTSITRHRYTFDATFLLNTVQYRKCAGNSALTAYTMLLLLYFLSYNVRYVWCRMCLVSYNKYFGGSWTMKTSSECLFIDICCVLSSLVRTQILLLFSFYYFVLICGSPFLYSFVLFYTISSTLLYCSL